MASFPALIQDLLEEVLCPICRDYFTNPMTIDCGHSFCQRCLQRMCQAASVTFSCPECRSVPTTRNFRANVQLGKQAAVAKELSSKYLQSPRWQSMCETHHKAKILFCEDDQHPICMFCSQSGKHKGHTLHCLDEAVETFRKKLQETIKALFSKMSDVTLQMANEKRALALLLEEVKTQMKTIPSEFQKIPGSQDELKNEYLSHLKRKGRANMKVLKKRIRALSLQNQELMKRITESQEVRRKPDVALLLDIKGVLSRNESVLQMEINAFPVVMFAYPIPGIREMLLNFKADITLDPDTAHPGLTISEDLKNMRYGGPEVEVPCSSRAFSDFAQVLGTQCFISSKHYWEVEVPGKTGWLVGISKGGAVPEAFFVLMSTQSPHGYYIYAIGKHHLDSEPIVKYLRTCVSTMSVGIFLDYEGGEISLYNVQERSLIFTFPNISFSRSLQPFFGLSKKVLTNDGSLRISLSN